MCGVYIHCVSLKEPATTEIYTDLPTLSLHDALPIYVVWAGRIVSESTLTSHINAVRKAIGDSGGQQRLIRTIARKGYRFVGDVRDSDASEKIGRAHV